VPESHRQIDARDNDQSSALHKAAFNNSAAATTALLEHKASVDVRDCNQMTPLHIAGACDVAAIRAR
jgi:ankyrin repeat protein